MAKNTFPLGGSHALGTLGLLLMLTVAKLVPAAHHGRSTVRGRLRSVFARRALDGIGAIGWMVDHVPFQHDGRRHHSGGGNTRVPLARNRAVRHGV